MVGPYCQMFMSTRTRLWYGPIARCLWIPGPDYGMALLPDVYEYQDPAMVGPYSQMFMNTRTRLPIKQAGKQYLPRPLASNEACHLYASFLDDNYE